ncbi:MAG: AlpA family transcriptional regulator [Pseudomonadota bacterium]
MSIHDRLLNRAEVEERFGIPKRYLEMAVMRGDGPPFIRTGRLVRYSINDIEAWITARRVEPGQI